MTKGIRNSSIKEKQRGQRASLLIFARDTTPALWCICRICPLSIKFELIRPSWPSYLLLNTVGHYGIGDSIERRSDYMSTRNMAMFAM